MSIANRCPILFAVCALWFSAAQASAQNQNLHDMSRSSALEEHATDQRLSFASQALPAARPLVLNLLKPSDVPLFNLALLPDQPASAPASAGGGGGDGGDAAELAKKLSNPVASLISVPFQFNYDEGYGPKDAGRFVLNIQPVIPVSLNEDWNLIIRTILPVVYQDSPANGIGSEFGMGDVVQSFFFSPAKPTSGGLVWGLGPVFLWPTATSDQLGSEKWGAGPTGLLLKQDKGWTYGVLANHIWSYAGNEDRGDVNATFLQPFISYTWPSATTLGFNTESTYDWNAEQWTVPLNLFVSQLIKIGGQPVSLSLGGRYYVESPDGGPEWGIRFTFTLLFPK